MKAEAMATRMSVLTRALPMRILIVDDDALELAAMGDRLTAAGFEVEGCANGEQALELLGRQWMPLVITDWQMPVMDGIAFTEQLRARGIDDTYVIMLTMRETGVDYERGYYAGVDDYLSKKLPDAELFVRIHAGFNTLALRRSLQETRAELISVSRIDPESGAASVDETMTRLQAEIRRAQRYGRMLSVMTVGVHDATPTATGMPSAALHAVVKALQGVVRTHIDWVGRLPATGGSCAFAVVLPEAAATDGPAIKLRMRNVLERANEAAHELADYGLTFDYGLTSLDRAGRDGKPVDAKDLLDVAEQCRGCSGHAGVAQLGAVQRSVATGVTISCRQGYAVESSCAFKSSVPLIDAHRDSLASQRAS